MRHYPANSPQAAARVIALALVADGHVSRAELQALERLDVYRQLGISPADMQALLQQFCEDLMQAWPQQWGDVSQLAPTVLDQVLADIDDPVLRRRVLQLCVAVVEADGHVADGEAVVLGEALHQWGLQRMMFDTPVRALSPN